MHETPVDTGLGEEFDTQCYPTLQEVFVTQTGDY